MSVVVEPTVPSLSREQQRTLLAVAEEAIRARLEGRNPDYARLGSLSGAIAERLACFVSLHDDDGSLLGCIGSMEGYRPLVQDVAENAVAAAFADPRLPQLTPAQFERMDLEISVLSPMAPVAADSMAELEAVIEEGVDGLLVTAGHHRGTFLPAVWRSTNSRREFLGLLWQKAGMRPGTWPRGLQVARYRTLEFDAPGPRPPIAA